MAFIKLVSDTLALSEGATEDEVLASIEILRETADKVETLTEALDTVTADRDTIQAKFDELAAKETERALDQACADGRIAASERDDYLDILTRCGESLANRAYFADRIGVTEVGTAGTDAERGNHVTISSECAALADRLVQEQGLNEAAALGRAMQIVLSDPTKLAAYESENLDA